jgi:hypothetical protein
MNAVKLPPMNAGEVGRRMAADLASPSLRAAIVSGSSTVAVAARIAARQQKLFGRAVAHVKDPRDAAALVLRIRRAGDAVVVVSGIDEFTAEEWERVDLLRSRLVRGASTFFVLSRSSFALLETNAPNFASLMSNPLTQMEGESSNREVEEEADQAEFDRLSRTWLDQTMITSSLTKKVENPAYQAIIAMGERAIPPILRDLEREPKLWGPALHAITGANPVKKGEEGKVKLVAKSWIQWAKDNKYEW